VKNDMTVAREEIFGPVVSIIKVADDEEAVRVANDSIYGLGGAVWSRDLARARGLANRLETGTVWINDYHLLNVRFPFGGYKQSGFGRELGPQGLDEFQQIKHIHVGEATDAADKAAYLGLLFDEV
jgi:betaine-aldehyde dehydrogenase